MPGWHHSCQSAWTGPVGESSGRRVDQRSLTAGSCQTGAPILGDRSLADRSAHPWRQYQADCVLPERSVVRVSRALAPKETALCHSVPVPPTPLPTSDVDVYFETSADDNEHARFQKAKEQLEIRHRNRMDRVSCGLPISAWRWALGHGFHS